MINPILPETGAKTEVPEIQEQTQQQAMSSKRLANSATDIISPVKEEATDTTMDGLSPMTPPETTSPKTRKRGHPSPTPDSEPSNKKCKETPFSPSQNGNLVAPPPTFPSPPGMPATVHDKATWQGFCDIESEPAYFSVLLREMGVQDVTVREVFSMDHDFILANIPQPIYGFILLFHYREFGNDDQPAECPPDVWFANQLPAQNSCATLAMINILMNQSASSTADGVQIGEHLAQFKDFTTDMTPYQRGEALASFDFVKRIHNSFAKKMDILEADKHLSSKVKRATSQHKPSKNAPGTKSRRRRAVSTASATSASSSESVQENAHHYIAFVPCGTQIYKLDGLDKQPTCMGPFDPIRGETWLQAVCTTIATLMAAGDDDYGVIALTQSPLVSLRQQATTNMTALTHLEQRLDAVCQDWKAFLPASSEDDVQSHPPSPHETNPEALLHHRKHLLSHAHSLALSITTETAALADEDAKAKLRRFDAGPVVQLWLQMLASNGFLESNLKRFVGGGAGRR